MVAKNAIYKGLSESYHDNEVNRLLIWIATATRQLLDIKGHSIGTQVCGQFCKNFPNAGYGDLTFRNACNCIIHAVEILSYDPNEDAETDAAAWKVDYYKGTITIRGKRRVRRAQQTTRALLDGGKFAQYSILLSEEFIEKV